MRVGETIIIDNCDLVVTQVRLDRTASGITAMIQLADPILYMKEKIERDAREEYVNKHKKMMDTITKNLQGEEDKLTGGD
jgi:methionine synthase II (cobalamin-independent)